MQTHDDLKSAALATEPASLGLKAVPTKVIKEVKVMANWQTVEVNTDLLIVGGGFAACGVATEAAYWAKKKGLKVTLVDKAALDRSGAVAMGLSAINQYVGVRDGENTVEDYVRYVRQDLMGISREDLVYNIARHVDSTVHLFEKWGLKIWTDDAGKYVHEGRWQLMINGESYKIIIAEAAKNAIADAGGEIYERVFIVEPLVDNNKITGAVGFSTREEKFYVFKAKAVVCTMGGAVHVFRPRSVGEGFGRSWYPPFNTGSSAYFTIKAGAEMTCQEVRFIPVRFKDAYGPVGAWFLLFKSRAISAGGGEYMVSPEGRAEQLGTLWPCETHSGQPEELPRHVGCGRRLGPALHGDLGGHRQPGQAVRGRSQGLQEEDERTGVRGMGRLPRHDDFPGPPLGGPEHQTGRETL